MAGNTLMKLLIEIGVDTTAAQKGLKGVEADAKKAGGGISNAFLSAKQSIGSMVAQTTAIIGAFSGVALAVRGIVNSTVEYANEVRQLSTLSGQSAEESSRFIQVLDDYKISAQDALVATRALTKEGHTPSIDTLAKLSDQYLSLNTVEQKNEFVLKNLGRGGLQWVEVLNKGSKAIREQGAAVSEGLILNDKQLRQARELELAQDQLNDSWQAMSITIGNKLIPATTGVINEFNRTARAMEIMKEKGLNVWAEMALSSDEYVAALAQAGEEQEAQNKAMLESKNAADQAAEGIDNLTDTQKAAEDAAKKLSQVYQGLLSSMFTIQQEGDDFAQTTKDLAASDVELAAEKQRLTLKMWEEQRAGKMTNDEYLDYIKNLDEITKKQEENKTKLAEAGAEHEKAGRQRVYDLVQQKLAADGVVNSGEFEYLQNLAVQQGLVSRAAADQAISENALADSMVSSFAKTQPTMQATLTTMQQIAGYNGTVVNFGVNFGTTGSVWDPRGFGYAERSSGASGMGSAWDPRGYGYTGRSSGTGTTGGRRVSRDSGGAGFAGTPYMIGTGAQPEMFIPASHGSFIPNADKKGFGATYNIQIFNPKKEAAENSIRSALKSLSYTGAAA